MPEGKGIGQSAELRAENHKPSHTAGNFRGSPGFP